MTPKARPQQSIVQAYIRRQGLRQTVKAMVDFTCGFVAAATPWLLLGDGRHALPLDQIGFLAIGVGVMVAAVNAIGGGYRAVWHYVGIKEGATLASSAGAVLVAMLGLRALGVVQIEPADVLLTSLLVYALCSLARVLRRFQVAAQKRRLRSHRAASKVLRERRVLIVGAGDAGVMVSQELEPGDALLQVVGFLDDDSSKHGTRIRGIPVLGDVASLFDVCEEKDVTEVIVAMPSADAEYVRSLVRRLEDVGLRVRAIPGINRLVNGGEVFRPGVIGVQDLLSEWNSRELATPREGHVLVTGGAGFIGSHLTRMLLDRGYNVRVLDTFAYGSTGLDEIRDHPRLEIMRGDICSIRDVSHAVRDVESVIALAAIVGDPACNVDFEETINLNYASTKVLTEAADFYGVKRLVFASSCSVYGAGADENELLTERSRLNPVSLYARTRVLSENIIFDRCGEVEPVVLRLATVFGLSPRMRFDLVVNTLTVRAVVDGAISIFGGNQWRPNVHCRDAARAFLMAIEAPGSAVAGQIFNVGGDSENYRISEMGQMVADIVGDVQVARQNEVPDPRNYRVSFEKIRKSIGFVPAYSVADGIREVAAAVREDSSLQQHGQPIFHNVESIRNLLSEAEQTRLLRV